MRHEPGENHPDKNGGESEAVVLQADHFVIEAEDVLADEARWGVMMMDRGCG